MLDYSEQRDLGFATFFPEFVEFTTDLGKCTSNEILMFGRAIAYTGSATGAIRNACMKFSDQDFKEEVRKLPAGTSPIKIEEFRNEYYRDSCPDYDVGGVVADALKANVVDTVQRFTGAFTRAFKSKSGGLNALMDRGTFARGLALEVNTCKASELREK